MSQTRRKCSGQSTQPTQSERRLFERVPESGSTRGRRLFRRISSNPVDAPMVQALQCPVSKPQPDSPSRASGVVSSATGRTNVQRGRSPAADRNQTESVKADLQQSMDYDDLWDVCVSSVAEPEPIKGEGSSVEGLPVNESLSKHIDYWRSITDNGFVLDMVKNGLSIPFCNLPRAKHMSNNKSAVAESVFVEKTMRAFLNDGFISEVKARPRVINPLSVTLSSGKKRFILDLRYVNEFIQPPKFKLDDLKIALEFVRKGGYMVSFDIKSGYYHLQVHKDYREYLGFSWKFSSEHKSRFFVFNVLPFGLSLGPFLFTKLLRPVIEHWRASGIKALIYIDDGFITASDFEKTKTQAVMCKQDLENLGFFMNEKCIWDPVQEIKYLGLIINLHDYVLKIPIEKIEKVRSLISKLLGRTKVSARDLAKVAGNLISVGLVVGSVTRLKTRKIYGFITSANAWDSKVKLPEEVKTELLFWHAFLTCCDTSKLLEYAPPKVLAWADASSNGGAAIVSYSGKSKHVIMNFEYPEVIESSTFRELRAIELGVASFVREMGHSIVKFYTDNQGAVSIVRNGSSNLKLQAIAERIYEMCQRHSITLEIEWIPRDINNVADYYSRNFDWDDWRITTWIFKLLNETWGPFSIDRFANHVNRKTFRFNSRIWYPDCEAVDAFSQDWKGDKNWLVPPIHLIQRCLRHLKACKAVGCIVVPVWKSASYWPDLLEYIQSSKTKDFCQFNPKFQLFESGTQRGVFGPGFRSSVNAYLLDFT